MADAKRELQSLGDVFGSPVEPADAEVQARVRRVVAAHAHGVEDCRLLLEALGLLPGPTPIGH
ncbi:hypothetical protein [Kitasatospora terrestris]|uniref:Uncharacterized protein n=1 Tax=Kitasatospora terrestris TaxID=258051 RepID=A0ABP9ENV4_9ACTN